MRGNLLIVLAVLLLAGCRTEEHTAREAREAREVALDNVFSLRDMPGDDGCVPGTYRSPHVFKGETFYAICTDAKEYR